MGDRFRSEDQHEEKDTPTSGDDVERPISEPRSTGATDPMEDSPFETAAAFIDWLSEWDDVRSDAPESTEPAPETKSDSSEPVDPAQPTSESDVSETDTVEADISEADDLASDVLASDISEADDLASDDLASDVVAFDVLASGLLGTDPLAFPPPPVSIPAPPPPPEVPNIVDPEAVGEDPTLPDPDARVPSPPRVRTQTEPPDGVASLIRPSRPQPVSDTSLPSGPQATTVTGSAPAFRVDPPGTVSEVGPVPVVEQARQTTSRTVRLGGLDVTIDATQRAMLVTAVIGMVVVAGLFAYLLSGLGSQTDTAARQADPDVPVDDDSPNLNVSATTVAAPSTAELAQTTVRIAGLDEAGDTVCAGSGVLVGEEGVILTNAHVVVADDDCPISTIAVGVTLDTSDPPELRYEAEVLVTDADLDLAVLRVTGVLSPDDELDLKPNFPTAILGDSDQVDLGENLRILGYPVIGGVTITQTAGSVSGFVAEDGVGSRALMKTDAAISAGSSGGMAVNRAGEVIGIPTRAGANGLGPAVDCREVSDTNDDGQIDTDDVCMPIGGFLNSIRPINLARDVLARAEAVQREAGRTVAGGRPIDMSMVSFWNPRFSTGEGGDSPTDEVVTVARGIEEICLFVDWTGIPNGVPWAAVWSHDGQPIEDFEIHKVWEYGESGRNFWYCAEDRRGHPAGVYEVGLFINDQLAFVEAIEVTDVPVEIHEVAWVNKTDQEVCGLAVNPLTASRHAGVNMLEPGDSMGPGESLVIDLPAGQVIVEAYDCNGMAIAAELDGISIPEDLFVDGEQVPLVIGGTESNDSR